MTKVVSIESQANCPFCTPEINSRQGVYEGRFWMVLLDYRPVVQGHVLIVPKEHARTRHELSREAHAELFDIQYKIRQVLLTLFGGTTEDIQFEKNGLQAGQSVNHFHIHVLPITTENSSFIARLSILFRVLVPLGGKLSDEKLSQQVAEWRRVFENEAVA